MQEEKKEEKKKARRSFVQPSGYSRLFCAEAALSLWNSSKINLASFLVCCFVTEVFQLPCGLLGGKCSPWAEPVPDVLHGQASAMLVSALRAIHGHHTADHF